jgi:NADH-quinone oxidoreductase subunit H
LFGPPLLRAILPVIYFIVKTCIFIFVFIWLRATLPRLRYDRLMDLGWRVMLPVGLLWVLLTGFSVVIRQTAERTTVLRYAALGAGIAVALYLLAPLLSHLPRRGGGGPALPESGGEKAKLPSEKAGV